MKTILTVFKYKSDSYGGQRDTAFISRNTDSKKKKKVMNH